MWSKSFIVVLVVVVSVCSISRIESTPVKKGNVQLSGLPAKSGAVKFTSEEGSSSSDDDDDKIDDEYDKYEDYLLENEKPKKNKKKQASNDQKGSKSKGSRSKKGSSNIENLEEIFDSIDINVAPKKTKTGKFLLKPSKTSKSKKQKESNKELSDAGSGSDEYVPASSKNVEFIQDSDKFESSLKLNHDISKRNEPIFLEEDKSGEYHSIIPHLEAKGKDQYDKGIGAIQFDKKTKSSAVKFTSKEYYADDDDSDDDDDYIDDEYDKYEDYLLENEKPKKNKKNQASNDQKGSKSKGSRSKKGSSNSDNLEEIFDSIDINVAPKKTKTGQPNKGSQPSKTSKSKKQKELKKKLSDAGSGSDEDVSASSKTSKSKKQKRSIKKLSDAGSGSDEDVPASSKNVEFIQDSDKFECSLKLNHDISKRNEPIFLEEDKSGEYHLIIPHLVAKGKDRYDKGIGAIQFDKKTSIYLACPGKDNSLQDKGVNNDAEQITCSSGKEVFTHNENVDKLTKSSDLTCAKPPEPRAIYNKVMTPCGDAGGADHGTLVEIGFPAKGWQKLIDVCYNATNIRTLYASHILYGSVLAGAVVDSKRPNFNKGQDEFYQGNPLEYYKKESQKAVIKELTGSGKYYDSALLFLAKGHFAPDADFLLKSWQDATYFFVNAAPQWQCINQGHWLSVERLARKIAMKTGENLDVSTGPYGTMELPNRDGVKEKLYLRIPQKLNSKKSKKQQEYPLLAVPDSYWKIIHRPQTDECIVFTSSNNPFSDKPTKLCTSICDQYNWPKLWDQKKGFVSCCAYEDFKKTVTYAPTYNCSGGILVGP